MLAYDFSAFGNRVISPRLGRQQRCQTEKSNPE
jgi:hypothetical protein